MLNQAEIAAAMDGGAFDFYYQPKISLVTGKVYGAEALVRLIQPDGSVILPDQFIPEAERTGQIRALTRHLFGKLVKDLDTINRAGPTLAVSFNASARDFEDDAFTRQVLHALKASRLPVDCLQIELTETALLEAGERIRSNILPLQEAGVGLAMDDFGKGYSSLDTLSKWPFNTIKLDLGMVQRMFESEKNLTIVENTIRMAHELGISVVAEGVEDYQQYHSLLEAGCTRVQGYWISKPLPLARFIDFVKEDLSWSGMPVGLIHMAIVDHVQWRRKLVGELVRALSLPQDSPHRRQLNLPPLSSQECKLGHWYDGVGQMFSARPAFRELDEPHRALHEIGSSLVNQVQNGATSAEITPGLHLLSQYSMRMLELLHSLEYQGMLDMHQALGEWLAHSLHPLNQVEAAGDLAPA